MKKNNIRCYIFILAICLSSCNGIGIVYKAYVNNEYNLRVLQYKENENFVGIDEYYYTSDIYSGHIEINITIPEEIDGMKVDGLGRPHSYQIGEHPQYEHDYSLPYYGSDKEVGFAIMCNSYFEEGTTFDITINIDANINYFKLEYGRRYDDKPNSIQFYKNGNNDDNYGVVQIFPCNLYFNLSNNNTKFYSLNGVIFDENDTPILMNLRKFVTVMDN